VLLGRKTWITENLTTLPDVEKWVGLKSIGMVEQICLIGEKETVEFLTLILHLDRVLYRMQRTQDCIFK